MNTDSFAYEIETEYFYKDIAGEVEMRFDISRYSKDDSRPLQIRKKKKVIGMMKDELGGKIMTEFVALRAKMYVYIKLDEKLEDKRCKGKKKIVVAKYLLFITIRPACLTLRLIHREQMLFETNKREVYMVNKRNRVLHRDNDKRKIQTHVIMAIARGYSA